MATAPDAPALLVTRILNWFQKVSPLRLPVPYAGAWYITRNNFCGETPAQEEFGIEPRPLGDSVRDTLEWMAATGRMEPSLFGKLAS